ncbi:MAG: hypothetical protein IKM91_01145 [Candidatus Methanomethylophilaceae archaeon]|nr:hypothetical protein [Candidatus Methanomethylophilaceae archaeon]MBR6870211.1 hypothetical protein [Candidatus Methanomethylophilaceae archaeon]
MVFGLFRKKNKKSETSEPINNNPDFITNDHPKRGEPVEKEVFDSSDSPKSDEDSLIGPSFKISYLGNVGSSTGSTKADFYVYEWYIKDTGEIFYVGKGRGDRYKEFHGDSGDAEKVRGTHDTDVKFVAENLTEEEALEFESIVTNLMFLNYKDLR